MTLLPIEEYSKTGEARPYVAEHLFKGNIVLFLGAGVSRGLGLPGWGPFLGQLADQVGVDLGKDVLDMNNDEMETLGSDIEVAMGDNGEFLDQAKRALYGDEFAAKGVGPKALITDPTLASLCSLMIGSKRGRVRDVITLNYDSMLEEYLRVAGYTVRSVSSLPAMTGDEDVVIYHPHGYLPSDKGPGSPSKKIILSKMAIFSRLGENKNEWLNMIRGYVRSKISIFVGLSEDSAKSAAFSPIYAAESDNIKDERVSGIWLFTKEIDPSTESMLRRMNIAPLVLDGASGVQDFLLSVVQAAAAEIN